MLEEIQLLLKLDDMQLKLQLSWLHDTEDDFFDDDMELQENLLEKELLMLEDGLLDKQDWNECEVENEDNEDVW